MDWLEDAWRFLKSEENQKTLTFIGAGIAVAGAVVWQLYTYFAPSVSSEQVSPTVTASGGGVVSGKDIRITQTGPGTLIVGGVHGIPPEDFQKVSAELGITEAALASFFKILEKQKVAPEDLDSTLRDFAKRHKQLEEDLKRYTSDDPEVAALREQARAALEAGDFDRAEQLLNDASAKDLAAAERQESVARTTPALGRPVQGQQRRFEVDTIRLSGGGGVLPSGRRTSPRRGGGATRRVSEPSRTRGRMTPGTIAMPKDP